MWALNLKSYELVGWDGLATETEKKLYLHRREEIDFIWVMKDKENNFSFELYSLSPFSQICIYFLPLSS